jgi:hypothetical protein
MRAQALQQLRSASGESTGGSAGIDHEGIAAAVANVTAAILTSPVVVAADAILRQQCGKDLSSAAVTPTACSNKAATSSTVQDVPAATDSSLVRVRITAFSLCCCMLRHYMLRFIQRYWAITSTYCERSQYVYTV